MRHVRDQTHAMLFRMDIDGLGPTLVIHICDPLKREWRRASSPQRHGVARGMRWQRRWTRL
jgi:hypothetical protein